MLGQSMYNSAAAEASHYNFPYLKSLEERVNRLSSEESDCMLSFWTDDLKCFQISPNMATSRVSITTTCLCINTILANPDHWTGRCRWDSVLPLISTTKNDDNNNSNNNKPFLSNKPTLISLYDAMCALEAAPWSGDAFQTPLLVRTFCQLGAMDKVDHPSQLSRTERGLAPFNN